jgi:hypothetical protein
LGRFPLRRVRDYPDTAPPEWLEHGGVMLPVYQREAMWLSFSSHRGEPGALQVGVGKVCAVSGQPWIEKLRQRPQNYLAIPAQPWLEGINAGDGFVRQFVAVRLGSGATVEGQVTGAETVGGVQLRAVGLSKRARAKWKRNRKRAAKAWSEDCCGFAPEPVADSGPSMGLGAGGRMVQEVYADQRPRKDYDPDRSWRVFVHLCSATRWTRITGETPPPSPADRDAYVEAGLPWFDYYDDDAAALAAAEALANLKTVDEVLGIEAIPHPPVHPSAVIKLKDPGGIGVVDGEW